MRVAIIPAYNEEVTIGSIVIETLSYVEQVIVVDDGSTDATAMIAQKAGAEVISHEQNSGKGSAIRTGLKDIDRNAVDTIAMLDGDCQHDPSDLIAMFDPVEAGDADFVIGSRVRDGKGEISRHRRFGRTFLDRVTNIFGHKSISDTQSGFRVLDAAVVDDVFPREDGMGVESEMLMYAQKQGLTIVEVPINNHYPDRDTSSQPPVRHGFTVVVSVLRIIRGQYPLAVFGTIGFVCLLVGFIFGYNTTTHYYTTGVFWPGKAMLSMLFSIVGAQFLIGGAILDYLKIITVNHTTETRREE